MNDVENLKGAYFQLGSARVMWGNFLNVMIDFVVVALVVYFGVKLLKLDRLDKKKKQIISKRLCTSWDFVNSIVM